MRHTKMVAGIVFAAVMTLGLISMQNAQAATEGKAGTNTTSLWCNVQAPVVPNTEVECSGFTDNELITDLCIEVHDPNGNPRSFVDGNGNTHTSPWCIDPYEDNGPEDENGNDGERVTSISFNVGSETGSWKVWFTWSGIANGIHVEDFADVHVSFFVLPESAIGAVALASAPIAALGFYLYRKNSL